MSRYAPLKSGDRDAPSEHDASSSSEDTSADMTGPDSDESEGKVDMNTGGESTSDMEGSSGDLQDEDSGSEDSRIPSWSNSSFVPRGAQPSRTLNHRGKTPDHGAAVQGTHTSPKIAAAQAPMLNFDLGADANLDMGVVMATTLTGTVTTIIPNGAKALERLREQRREREKKQQELQLAASNANADSSTSAKSGSDDEDARRLLNENLNFDFDEEAQVVAAALREEEVAERSYYGFIRVADANLQQDVIFYCTDVRSSDFDLQLAKDDVVELQIAQRSKALAEQDSSGRRKARAQWVRVKYYATGSGAATTRSKNRRRDSAFSLTSTASLQTRGVKQLSCAAMSATRSRTTTVSNRASTSSGVSSRTEVMWPSHHWKTSARLPFWNLCAREIGAMLESAFVAFITSSSSSCSSGARSSSSSADLGQAILLVLRTCAMSDVASSTGCHDSAVGCGSSDEDKSTTRKIEHLILSISRCYFSKGSSLENRDESGLPSQSDGDQPFRHRKRDFFLPNKHTPSGKLCGHKERLGFFITTIMSCASGARTAQSILDEALTPVLKLCSRNATLLQNFVAPALEKLRSSHIEDGSAINKIYHEILLQQAKVNIAEGRPRNRSGADEKHGKHFEDTAADNEDSLFQMECFGFSWKELASRKPSLRELRDGTAIFRDLQNSRVLKALPYDDEDHYMSVYSRLFRAEAYSGLCRQVERVIDLVNGDAGVKKLNFLEAKVYRAAFAGYYPLQSGPHKGEIGLAFSSVQPDYPLYADAKAKLAKSWAARGLMAGTLLACSLDGSFTNQSGLLYLTVVLKDDAQLREQHVFVALPVADANSGFQSSSVIGGRTSHRHDGWPSEAGVYAQIRAMLNAHTTGGSTECGATIRLVENPGFYPACGPVLRNLVAKDAVPFQDTLVHCQPPSDLDPGLPRAIASRCRIGTGVPDDELEVLYPLEAKFPRELVMKVKVTDEMKAWPHSRLLWEADNVVSLREFLEAVHTLAVFHTDVDKQMSWLSSSELHREQLEAIAHALTHSVTVIKGAPGTGKTFLAVRIVLILRRMMMKGDRASNSEWEPGSERPKGFTQLVLSYKNHATDEFSLDVLEHKVPVVRVGGRSSAAKLREHTLQSLVLRSRHDKKYSSAWELHSSSEDFRDEFAHNVKEIRRRFKAEERIEFSPRLLAAVLNLAQLVSLLQTWAADKLTTRARRHTRAGQDPTPNECETRAATFLQKQAIPVLTYIRDVFRQKAWPMPTLETLIRFCNLWQLNDPLFETQMSEENMQQAQQLVYRLLADLLPHLLQPVFCQVVVDWVPPARCHQNLVEHLRGPVLFSDDPSVVARAVAQQGPNPFEAGTGTALGSGDADDALSSDDDDAVLDRAVLLQEALAEVEYDQVKKIHKDERAVKINEIARPGDRGRCAKHPETRAVSLLPEVANSGRLKGNAQVKDQLLTQEDLWRLNDDDRCRFVHVVLERAAEARQDAIAKMESDLQNIANTHRRRDQLEKLAVMADKCKQPVLSMTIDGACIQNELLEQCNVDVVFFEEAGELLESKQIACIPRTARHLVMIGDPLQLPPNPDTFELKEHFDFGTSLMERLINNGYPYKTLMRQSRMHPDISRLSRHTYPQLENHEAVVGALEKFPGLANRVHFWDTGSLYREVKERSVTNGEEAQRAVGIAQNLVYNGVPPEKIGVLAMYKGQARLIRDLIKRSENFGVEAFLKQPLPKKNALVSELLDKGRNPLSKSGGPAAYTKDEKGRTVSYSKLEDVAVDSVDNFQGDQRDYVIVSFCRSNDNHDCGFLKKADSGPQRLNVALTRARCGLFLIGDRACLETDYPVSGKDRKTHERLFDKTRPVPNAVFKNLFADLDEGKLVSKKLELHCERHPENGGLVCTTAADWALGAFQCRETCGKTLSACQHTCKQQCHPGLCPANLCREPVVVECPNGIADHPAWTAFCYEQGNAKCRSIVNFDCGRCRDDDLFSDPVQKQACKERRTPLSRLCFETEREVAKTCSATYHYTCRNGDHHYTRRCHEDEIAQCLQQTTCVRKDCGHLFEKRCYALDKTNTVEFEQLLEDLAETPCQEEVCEPCARCGEGALVRVCSEAQPRDRCRRKLPYHCAACGHESQRPCEVPEAEYRCPAVLEELCRDCGVATVKRVCSETAPQQPCTHEIDHTCVDCGEVAKKLCSAPGGSFVCQAVYPHTCGECGLVGDKQCGVRKYVCPALQPFNCGSCGAFVKHYQCGMPPTPEQLETDFLCLKEVDQECSECYTVGKRVCAMSPSEFVCRAPCKKVLPECGHPCARVCGLPCAREKSECRWCALELTKEWLNHGCLSEDKAPEHDYAVGTRCLLPVWKIEFTQASISTEMRSGASVDQQVEEIIRYCPEDLRPENFEKRFTCIKVYRMLECEYLRPILQDGSEGEPRAVWRTRFYALDNRRTALLKKCNPGGEVYVEISGDAKDFQSKYDPKGRAKLQHDEIRQVMGCAGPDKGAGVAPGAATATNKNKTKNKKVSKNKAAAPATDHEVLKGVEARTYGVAEGSSGTRFPSLKKKRKTNPNGKKANKKCNIEPFAATENVKVKNKNDGNNKKNKKNACKKQQSSSSSSADNEKSKASETPKGNDKNDDKREETEAEPTQAASSSQVFMQSLSGPLVHDDQDDSAGKKSNTKMYEEQVARLSAIFPAGEHGLVFAEAESVQISAEKSDLMSSPVVRIRGAGDAGRCKISNTEPLTAAPSPGSSSATKSTPGSRDYSMSPLPELDLQGESKSNTPAAAPPEGDPIPELLYPERPPLPGFDPVTIWRRPQKGKEEPRVKSKGAGKFAVVEHEQGKVVTRQILRTDAAGEMRNKAGTQIVLHHYELPIEPPEDHDDISLLRDGRRQRQIATSQRYVIIDDLDLVTDTVAGKSARAEVDLSSLETWATANLNAATPPTESPDCSAEGVSSRENTEVFERVVREAIDAPLRMMMESPVCLRKCLGFRRDAEPVVVVSSGLLYLLGLLHTTYVHDRFPDFSFQAYYDPDVRVMLLWRKIEEEFPERVTQHGVEGAREILRKSEERILAGKRFIQHVTSSRSTPTATCAPLSRDQEGVMRNANHAKLCNTTSTSTTSITCTLRRVPSLSCFLPVFPCQPHKNDPSFLLYGGGSYLRHGKQLQQNGKTLYAVVRKSNKKFREAADHGWKDKKLNSRIFFGANAYRQYNKLACGGTDGLLLGFYNEDDGRVEGVNAITSLEQFRNTFSWSLNHDLPQGGELYRVLFAQLFEKCARFSGKPLTVRKERGSAEEDHYGYQKAVTLRFEESSPGIDYSNELIDLIQSFTHKWQRIEQGRS